MKETSITLQEALDKLVGNRLASVEFVQDYVQLHFDGPTLTAFTHPEIYLASNTFSWGDSAYRDGVCRQIGSRVTSAVYKPVGVSIHFESGASLSISLKDEDYLGPEALQFSLGDARTWVA